MSGGFDILAKMDPMARRAVASIEAMQKAIDLNNRDDIEKHLHDARNAMDVLMSDLELHDKLTKQFQVQTDDVQAGMIMKFDNTDGDYSANDGAIALGVIRAGRTDKVFRPHRIY
tara:strand:- start:1552 stop:1896 length:345 start_codon:yes stop_codon:yes gene_type:complete